MGLRLEWVSGTYSTEETVVKTDWMGLRLEWVSGTYSTEETVMWRQTEWG